VRYYPPQCPMLGVTGGRGTGMSVYFRLTSNRQDRLDRLRPIPKRAPGAADKTVSFQKFDIATTSVFFAPGGKWDLVRILSSIENAGFSDTKLPMSVYNKPVIIHISREYRPQMTVNETVSPQDNRIIKCNRYDLNL